MREFAKVFTRMPNQATKQLPAMPISENSRMRPSLPTGNFAKYP